MSKIKIILLAIVVFFALLLIAGISSYYYIEKQINSPLGDNSSIKKEFIIEKGDSVSKIASNLEKEGFIKGSAYFQIYVWQKKMQNKLQAGEYEISSAMTIPEITNLLTGGKVKSNEVSVLIPEGFQLEEIDRKFAENGLIDEGELIEYNKNNNLDISKYEFLKDRSQKAVGFEGFYFPDTYKFFKNSTIEDIAKKMLDNFDAKFTQDLREEIKNQNKNVYEIIILASIIEKEAGSAEDMRGVSSVFNNRLKIGMNLESDATVNYIIKKGRTQATYEDLEVDSPYNTYKYPGLPPAPISNPGPEAIKAAINPERTDYYYFLTKENGEAVFSKTFEEHLANKSKYLR